jgi:ferritin
MRCRAQARNGPIHPQETPMFSTAVQDAINEQINNELSASYTYLAMSAYCERENFLGCAKWLRIQSKEEYGHGMRLLDFLLARQGTIKLKAIAEPMGKYKSIASVFEQALEQEQEVSKKIDKLYELTLKEKAFAALVQLQWFITEQVEEERSASEIVAKFHLVRDDPSALLDLDRELGSRVPGAEGGEPAP